MSEAPTLRECIQSFADRDYETCAEQALSLIDSGAPYEVLQVLLICLQRLDRTSLLDQLVPQILAVVASDPWHETLLRLTIGRVEGADALHLAQSDRQRCEAHYYIGARLLTLGQSEAAGDAFDACLNKQIECPERLLAAVEKSTLSSDHPKGEGTVDPKLGEVNRQVRQLHEQGRYAEAIPFAKSVRDRTREAFGEQHPQYVASLQNLAVLYASMGHNAEAEPLYQEAATICRVAFGEQHPNYATTLNNLAALYLCVANTPTASESPATCGLRGARRGKRRTASTMLAT